MRIAIVGAGGLGGYFGARLIAGGQADVHFIARGAHLAALHDRGLRIEGPTAITLPHVQATHDPRTIGRADYVLMCVKLWDLEAALEQIRPLVDADTTLLSFQNGVLKDDYLRAAYPAEQIMGGLAYVATTISEPGVIRQTGTMQRLVFGEFDGTRSARGERLLAACIAGGIAAELSSHIERDMWGKFVFLAGLSGATTTMRRAIGAIRTHPQTRAFLHDLMAEVVAVGRARGVPLPADLADQHMHFVDGLSPDMTASMHHDLEHGRRLEVRWLAGAVVELGARVGVPTPLNRAVADILALYADGRPG